MAQISESSITIKLNTLAVDEIGSGVVDVEVTIEEARELYTLLKERFETYTPLQYPQGTRTLSGPFANPGGNDPLANTTNIQFTGVNEDKNRSTS